MDAPTPKRSKARDAALSANAASLTKARARRDARQRKLRPQYSVKLAESCQVVHFNKAPEDNTDLDGLLWMVDQPDQPKIASWIHVDGCQTCLDLYEHITLPSGITVHHHCKKWPYHLDPDVTDLPPKPPKAPLHLATFATGAMLPHTPHDPLEASGMVQSSVPPSRNIPQSVRSTDGSSRRGTCVSDAIVFADRFG